MTYEETLLQTVLTQHERITADRIFNIGKCFVYSLVIASDGQGVADADVYDGMDTSGEEKYNLRCADKEMAQLVFPVPAYFQHGLFVDIGSNVKSVTVEYFSIRD
jgi:hypothetical protein